MLSTVRLHNTDKSNKVTIRQITEEEAAMTIPFFESEKAGWAPEGTWVIDATYDSGVASTQVNLEDVLRYVLLTNPTLVENVVREVNAYKALGDNPGLGT